MTKHSKIISLLVIVFSLFFALSFLNNAFAQEREDNPKTWKYFKILARATDDSIFIKLQDDLLIDPKIESYAIVINIMDAQPVNQYVVIGDESSPDAMRYAWSQLSKPVQEGLINWTGTNKENLNKKKLNYGSVFLDVIKKIKVKELIAPPQKEREIKNTTAYINPYLQAFGGEPLGIPLKRSFGFSFFLGTPYSGPLETDVVGANFHLLGASVGISTRIKELVYQRSAGNDVGKSSQMANYNNIFAPKLGLQISYVIPFGNFFEVGYYTVIDTGDYDPPISVYGNDDVNGVLMPNNVLNGSYTNFEFRYPFRTFGSTRAKVYAARYLGETHFGFSGREMRLAGSVFDVRIDAMLSGTRNYQFLIEAFVSNIGEGFSLSSFAIGPSIRLGKTKWGNFGALVVLVNARFKIGDYYEEK